MKRYRLTCLQRNQYAYICCVFRCVLRAMRKGFAQLIIVGLLFPVSRLYSSGNTVVSNAVAKVNDGTGFFVSGGDEYDGLLFFVTAKHVVDGIIISSVSSLSDDKEANQHHADNNIPSGILLVSEWFYHPDDISSSSGDKSGETHDVAVTIFNSSHSHYRTFIGNSLPIRYFKNYKKLQSNERVTIMNYNGQQFTKVIFTSEKYPNNKRSNGVIKVWAESLRAGDSGSPVFTDMETYKSTDVVIEQNVPSSLIVHGIIARVGIKKESGKHRKSLNLNTGTFIATSESILATINQAFFTWQVRQ